MNMDTSSGVTEDDDFLAKGDIKDDFNEYKEVVELIDNLPQSYGHQTTSELSDERFTFILDKYQEQPHLLDPHLEELLTKLLKYIRESDSANLRHSAFKYMYLITKVRGHKLIVRLFPHEVADLEPIMGLLAVQNPHDRLTWEDKYMLLLWLSMICLIPFDIEKFDGAGGIPLMIRIIDVGKLYLMFYADKCQEAAALVLSKLLTRPDAQESHLPAFIRWCTDNISKSINENSLTIATLQGPLLALANIFSIGKRSYTIAFAPTILDKIREHDLLHNKHSTIRKLSVKLVQRLGSTFLKPIIPKWRYQRGSRSLKDTLKTNMQEELKIQEEQDDEYDIPEEIEVVIEHLLNALYDSDTVVRWSAAKGIGRITGRLPRDLADEVVGSVLDCFTEISADGAYHGGCLTLAELGRRGLLLPHRLGDVVPILLYALVFDIKRGAFSVGANVRDSACYLAWSFARAYAAETIAPYVEKIARSLLIVTAYDREVNCRRAASASFQENVGRQGQFPHGIDILTRADYFAVGSRSDSYLIVGPYIAQFREYTAPFIDHLCEHKVDHWDPEIRWMAAKALNKIVPISPSYAAGDVLSKLLPICTGRDLVARHGSIIAVAEIIHALYEVESDTGNIGLISKSKHLKAIYDICNGLQEAKYFRGYGGSLMRLAICHLITRVSECRQLLKPWPKITECWQEVIHDTLSNLHLFDSLEVESICSAAVKALAEVNHITIPCTVFTDVAVNKKASGEVDKILDDYLDKLKSPSEKQRIGYSQAISALPQHVLKGRYNKLLNALMRATKPYSEKDKAFAESHMHAVQALIKISQRMTVDKDGDPNEVLCKQNLEEIFHTLIDSLSDYTKDSRGDVGSMVRLAGIRGLHKTMLMIVEKDKSVLDKYMVQKVICCILQQSGEKIHRVRDGARDALFALFHHNPRVPHISHHDELKAIFKDPDFMPDMKSLFQMTSRVLMFDVYLYHMLLGLVVSVGDITQSLAAASGEALCSHLDIIHRDETRMEKFSEALIKIFKNHIKVGRVSIPLLKTIQLILQRGFFSGIAELMEDPERKDETLAKVPDKLLTLVKQEILRTKDAQRLLTSIEVFCGFLQFPQQELRKRAISQLVRMLCHPFPKVRRSTATQLYESVLTYDDLIADVENLDTVMTILSEMVWDSPIELLRPERNKLCEYFDVPVPKPATKK